MKVGRRVSENCSARIETIFKDALAFIPLTSKLLKQPPPKARVCPCKGHRCCSKGTWLRALYGGGSVVSRPKVGGNAAKLQNTGPHSNMQ